MPLRFQCDCSKDRFLDGLATLDNSDIESLITSDEEVEIVCEFCKTKYTFSVDELKKIKEKK